MWFGPYTVCSFVNMILFWYVGYQVHEIAFNNNVNISCLFTGLLYRLCFQHKAEKQLNIFDQKAIQH